MARLWKRFPIRWRKAHLCEWDRTIAGERCVSTRFPEWRFLWTDRYCRFVFAWAILRFSICHSSYSMCVDVYNDMKDWAEILPSPRLVWTSINVIPVPIIVPVSCASTPQPSRAHTMAIRQPVAKQNVAIMEVSSSMITSMAAIMSHKSQLDMIMSIAIWNRIVFPRLCVCCLCTNIMGISINWKGIDIFYKKGSCATAQLPFPV